MRKPKKPSDKSAFSRALERLARRDRSEEEIRRALLREGHSAEAVDDVVRRLRERRLLDDRGFAARYARSRLQHQRLGRNRVRAALRQKGVARETAEAGLGEALEQVSETEAVDFLARRYWKARPDQEPGRKLRNLMAFLLRRGFPATLVVSRLQALWPRIKDALDGLEPAEDE